MDISIKKSNTNNCVETLNLTERCRKLLQKVSQDFVSNCDPIPEIDSLPYLIKNSLPSCDDKQEAKILIDELLEYDKAVLAWYDNVENLKY